MNSQSDSRSRFCPKYSFGSVASSFLLLVLRVVLALIVDDAAEAGPDRIDEHEIGEGEPGRLVLHEPRRHLGSVPSGGSATRCGPTTPRWRNADDAPGPPLKTNITGRWSSPASATYETEKISADGFSFFRSTTHFAVAV